MSSSDEDEAPGGKKGPFRINQTKALSKLQVETFLREAPDKEFVLIKVRLYITLIEE